MSTPVTVIPGGHAAAAKRVIEGLDEAVRLKTAGKDDEALVLLQGLKPDTADLRAASSDMHAMMKSEEDFAQGRLHATLEALATARDADSRLRVQIEGVRAESETNEARLQELSQQLDGYRNEMNRLQEKLRDLADELEDHQSKLSEWGWVPGYGAYLAIENISDMIQGKQGEFDAAARQFQDVADKMAPLEGESRTLNETRAALLAQLQALTERENELQNHMNLLEWFQQAQSASVAAAAVGASFYADLDASLQNVEDGLESTFNLARRLSEPVEVMDENLLRPGTLGEALLQLAIHADASTRIEVFTTNSFVPDSRGPDRMPISSRNQRFNLFVPFAVKEIFHFRGVSLPISGTDLRVELATGSALPEAFRDDPKPCSIDTPTVLASRQLVGDTPPGYHEIVFPETPMLFPGDRYFIVVWSADRHATLGSWMTDRRSHAAFGYFCAYANAWRIEPSGQTPPWGAAPIMTVYGTPAVETTILEALSPVPRPHSGRA